MEAPKKAAKAHDASWYKAWKKFFKEENFDLEQSRRRNAEWIKSKTEEGYTIYDIGVDPTRLQRSPFYQLERDILEATGYPTIPIARP